MKKICTVKKVSFMGINFQIMFVLSCQLGGQRLLLQGVLNLLNIYPQLNYFLYWKPPWIWCDSIQYSIFSYWCRVKIKHKILGDQTSGTMIGFDSFSCHCSNLKHGLHVPPWTLLFSSIQSRQLIKCI